MDVEGIKASSDALRGTLAASFADQEATHIGDADATLIKFHGSYQGYDRDSATERKQQGLDKEWEFMVRARIPGGTLSARQYLALDDLADAYGHGRLRVTTRQGFQFHGLAKGDLKPTIAGINEALLTTLAACGDVVRTVTATPAPYAGPVQQHLQAQARMLSKAMLPSTGGYHEIWLDKERVAGDPDPLYGDTYLPRKFKIGLATPDDNSVDVLTNDLAIVALYEGEALQGYNFLLGGGLGMTHNKPETYPRLATPICFVEPDDLLPAAKAVVAFQRDNGDRTNRKHARLKYVVAERGEAWVHQELERYFGRPLAAARPMPDFQVPDHMGWHDQGDGKWFLGLPIPSGRIENRGPWRLRAALRQVFERDLARPILMASQDMILADVAPENRSEIDVILAGHGVARAEDQTPLARWAMACPALPTCGQALNEAERIRIPLVSEMERVLARHGLEQEAIALRITGCANGCARSYNSEIGVVGRTARDYSIFLGGDFAGTRLNRLVFDRVPLEGVAPTLEPVLAAFAAGRREGERFGDFCHRLSNDELRGFALAQAA